MAVNWEVVLWSCITLVVIMGVIGMILFFISARNLRRRRADIGKVHTELRPGNRIMFAGGIFGKVVGIEDEVINVEVAKNTVIRISRYAIQSIEG